MANSLTTKLILICKIACFRNLFEQIIICPVKKCQYQQVLHMVQNLWQRPN